MIKSVFRRDPGNVGDWYCAPDRYFDLGVEQSLDILDRPTFDDGDDVILGGGGLIAATFEPLMRHVTEQRERLGSLIAWGIGESLRVDRSGARVAPWAGPLPDYLEKFDFVGVRDFGTEFDWVPCASCMLDHFDRDFPITRSAVLYEHKRIPLPIDGLPRRSNDGLDIDATIAFLASAELVITNSYHGAYWATLLGRRVIAIPNLSKMYRFKHAPVICAAEDWKIYAAHAPIYTDALQECRTANKNFMGKIRAFRSGQQNPSPNLI